MEFDLMTSKKPKRGRLRERYEMLNPAALRRGLLRLQDKLIELATSFRRKNPEPGSSWWNEGHRPYTLRFPLLSS